MWTKIIELLFPTYCLHTHETGEYLSKQGKKQLIPHPEICHLTHRSSSNFLTLTPDQSPLTGLIIAFTYSGYLKKLILKLKYYHQYAVADFLAQRLNILLQTNQSLQQDIQSKTTRLTHIPSHRRRRYFTKGYNQSELLATALSKHSYIPHTNALRTIKRHQAQTKRNRRQRFENLHNAFIQQQTQIQDGDCIIIVDDITTTGATIIQAAKTIKNYYPNCTIRGCAVGRRIG